MGNKHCFIYQRDKDEFKEIEKIDIAEQYFRHLSESPEKLESYATQNGSDAVLLFDKNVNKWTLVYAKGTGIVTQQTARRRADTASRAGILLTTGERIGISAPLDVLSQSNIGDLNKSVQNKYLTHTDLKGVE